MKPGSQLPVMHVSQCGHCALSAVMTDQLALTDWEVDCDLVLAVCHNIVQPLLVLPQGVAGQRSNLDTLGS